MAIIVYTSVDSDPINNRAEGLIDLSNGATLPVDVNIYAEAVDTADPTATFAFQWYLLSKPSISSASLLNANSNNTTLQSVDVWSNYRLFCVAQNISSGEFSETDILKAQNRAFLNINVLSENAGIEKPAKGERNWYDKANMWADSIENIYTSLGGFSGLPVEVDGIESTIPVDGSVVYRIEGTTNEVELTGIESPGLFTNKIGLPDSVQITSGLTVGSSGAGLLTVSGTANLNGQTNVGGALVAEDTFTVDGESTINGPMFINSTISSGTAPYASFYSDGSVWYMLRDNDGNGTLEPTPAEVLSKIDVPEETVRGAVLASDPVSFPVSGNALFNPDFKLPDHSIINFSQSVEGSIAVLQGAANENASDYIEAYLNTDAGIWPHIIHRNMTGKTLYTRGVNVMFHDLGYFDPAVDAEYVVSFVKTKNALGNAWTVIEGTATWNTTYSNHSANHELILNEGINIDSGDWFGIIVVSVAESAKPAIRMSGDITCFKPIV